MFVSGIAAMTKLMNKKHLNIVIKATMADLIASYREVRADIQSSKWHIPEVEEWHPSETDDHVLKTRPRCTHLYTWLATELCVLGYLQSFDDSRKHHVQSCLGYTSEGLVLPPPLGMNARQWIRSIPFDYARILRGLRQITAGLTYMHEHGIIHRDLWLGQIQMDADGTAIIVGLEPAGFHSESGVYPILPPFTDENHLFHKGVGIGYRWAAPEMLFDPNAASPASDIWALGTLLWQMFSNGASSPYPIHFGIEDILRFLRMGNRGYIDSSWPETIRRLIKRCWSMDPFRRPTAQEVYAELMTEEVQLEMVAYQRYVTTPATWDPLPESPIGNTCVLF